MEMRVVMVSEGVSVAVAIVVVVSQFTALSDDVFVFCPSASDWGCWILVDVGFSGVSFTVDISIYCIFLTECQIFNEII